MGKIIDGRKLAAVRTKNLQQKISKFPVTPKIISIVVGDDPASLLYTKIKQRKASEVGIEFEPRFFPTETEFEKLLSEIEILNGDQGSNGIMVQLPLPNKFLGIHQAKELLERIASVKDVDGLTESRLVLPATVKSVLSILGDEKIPVKGKKVVVLGRSPWLGKPLAEELEKMGGQVKVGHSQTTDLKQITREAEILISAVGRPGLVSADMVSEGATVIDVGTSKVGEKVVGDVDFDFVVSKASKITPVPGGVGPLTVVSLLENIIELMARDKKIRD